MLKLINYTSKPDAEWDRLVQQSASYSFYNSSARLNYLKKTLKRSVHRQAIFSKDKKLFAFFTYQTIRARRGKFLYAQHAPVLNYDHPKAGDYKYLTRMSNIIVEELLKQAKKDKVDFIRVNSLLVDQVDQVTPSQLPVNKVKKNSQPACQFTAVLMENDFRPSPIYHIDANTTQQVDLKDLKRSLKYLPKETQTKLEQARKDKNYTIKTYTKFDENLFKRFQKLEGKAKSIIQPVVKYSWTKEELKNYAKNKMLYIIEALNKDKQSVAICIFVKFGKYLATYYRAIDPKLINTFVPYKTTAHMMNQIPKLKSEILDLWGDIIPNHTPSSDQKKKPRKPKKQHHPWAKYNKLKRSLGGSTIQYLTIVDKPLTSRYSLTYFYEMISNIKKGYTR